MKLLPSTKAGRQVAYEIISGGSGFILALFMWGHMMFVGSILIGTYSFDWLALQLEVYFIAQPTVVAIFALFLVHAVVAARKIPAQLEDRRKMIKLGRDLKSQAHEESLLWIWQVRTGMIVLVLGSFVWRAYWHRVRNEPGARTSRLVVALRRAAHLCRIPRQHRAVPAGGEVGCFFAPRALGAAHD